MTEAEYGNAARASGCEIDRKDTGIRILLTLLFALIAGLVESVLAVIIVFALVWALITKQPPGLRVRALANRIITYYYRIGRYLTYNESRAPFPFSDFPDAFEESRWTPASESLGLSRSPGAEAKDREYGEFGDEENDATDSGDER
jgi:hypothetical protein